MRRVVLAFVISLASGGQVIAQTPGNPPSPASADFIACTRRWLDMPMRAPTKPVHHYVFFGGNREKIREDSAFLRTANIEGAQIIYPWRSLETGRNEYDFSAIREDLQFLRSKGRKLWIQLQDVTFSESRIFVPRYLLNDSTYHGGAAKQYMMEGVDESTARVAGWVARRWDPAVQERFQKLLSALGKEFDGEIAGINLPETSLDFGTSGRLFPDGFSHEAYRRAVVTNMTALKSAFPNSVTLQYANFMPGEWRPDEDKGYLSGVYSAAKAMKVGAGGPDLLPFRAGQLGSSYPLIREASGIVPTGVAVQDGNLAQKNPRTGRNVTAAELLKFATECLRVDYIFWGTEEPYYSSDVIPVLSQLTVKG